MKEIQDLESELEKKEVSFAHLNSAVVCPGLVIARFIFLGGEEGG